MNYLKKKTDESGFMIAGFALHEKRKQLFFHEIFFG